jgi:hypothetical protein
VQIRLIRQISGLSWPKGLGQSYELLRRNAYGKARATLNRRPKKIRANPLNQWPILGKGLRAELRAKAHATLKRRPKKIRGDPPNPLNLWPILGRGHIPS